MLIHISACDNDWEGVAFASAISPVKFNPNENNNTTTSHKSHLRLRG
jgi:hypothetical protein